MAVSPKVGGELDAFCNRCKLTLGHTILALVGTKIARVRCNTCGGDHALRGAGGPARPRSDPAGQDRRPGPERVVMGFDEVLAAKQKGSARAYSPKETYAVDEVIRHPEFGLGIVSAVRHDKVDVTFKTTQKTLVHGRAAGAAGQRPTFSPPKAPQEGPSDKPGPGEPAAEQKPS